MVTLTMVKIVTLMQYHKMLHNNMTKVNLSSIQVKSSKVLTRELKKVGTLSGPCRDLDSGLGRDSGLDLPRSGGNDDSIRLTDLLSEDSVTRLPDSVISDETYILKL